jgi:type IV pilus assembly protein PilC
MNNGKLRGSHVVILCKRLALLLKSGLPLGLALEFLAKSSEPKQKNSFDRLTKAVARGELLSVTLEKVSTRVNPTVFAILEVGENSGHLVECLDYAAGLLEKQKILQQKIVGIFLYPAVICFATIVLGGLLLGYLFPKIMPVFASLHVTLPWTTRMLIFVTNLISEHWLVLIVSLAALIGIAIFILTKTSAVKVIFNFILHLWIAGDCFRFYYTSYIARMLGISLIYSSDIFFALQTVSNSKIPSRYKINLFEISAEIKEGRPVAGSLYLEKSLWPLTFSQMVEAAESSGQFSQTFLFLADYYEQELDALVKRVNTLMEPALLIGLGLLVGFIAVSIITPIYGITQSFRP